MSWVQWRRVAQGQGFLDSLAVHDLDAHHEQLVAGLDVVLDLKGREPILG